MSFLAVAVFIALGVFVHWYADRLRRHRIDLSPVQSYVDGRSVYADINMLDPRNYNVEGKRKLRIIYFALALQALLGVFAVLSWP